LVQLLAAYGNWSFGELAIAIIVAIAVVAVVVVFTRAAGVTIPGWLVQILWIVLAAICAILAVRFLLSL
jgi:hypothetical protein